MKPSTYILAFLAILTTLSPALAAEGSSHVPDTLDIRRSAELAVRCISARLDEAKDCLPFSCVRDQWGEDPKPVHSERDCGDLSGRCLDGLVLGREICGTRAGLARQLQLTKLLLSNTGEDGLVKGTRAVEDQVGVMYAFVSLYQHDPDPEVKSKLESMVRGVSKLIPDRGDYVQPPVNDAAQWGSILPPMVRFYEITGFKPALAFAEKLTRYILYHDKIIRTDGAFSVEEARQTEIESWAKTLVGVIRCSDVSKSIDRKAAVDKAFFACNSWRNGYLTTRYGCVAGAAVSEKCDSCSVASMVGLAIELAHHGHRELYDDVERFVRNQLWENQVRNVSWVRGPNRFSVQEMMLGAFDSAAQTNELLTEDVRTRSTPSGLRALFQVWNSIVTEGKDGVWVNLFFNRNMPLAEVRSFIPYEGKVEVILHKDGPLHIRIPDWVDKIDVKRSGEGKPGRWLNGYFHIEDGKKDETFTLTFPQRRKSEDCTFGKESYHVDWKGDTVIMVQPEGRRYPTYQGREKFLQETCPMKDELRNSPVRTSVTW